MLERLIFASIFFSFFGRTVFLVVASWELVQYDGGAAWVSIFFLLQNVADVAFGSMVGTLVDSLDRRIVYFAAEGLRTFAIGLAFIPIMFGGNPSWLIMAICVMGVVSITVDRCIVATYHGLFSEVYSSAILMRINSRSMLLNQLGSLFGALAGGYSTHRFGFGTSLVFLQLCFALSAVSILLWRPKNRQWSSAKTFRPSLLRGVRDGFATMGASGALQNQVLFQVTVLSFITLTNAALPGFVAFHMQRDGDVFGQMDSLWAFGAIFASFVVGALVSQTRGAAGPILLVLLGIAVAVFSIQSSYPASLLLYCLFGFLVAFCRIWSDARIQHLTPHDRIGRVRSTMTVVTAVLSGVLLLAMTVSSTLISSSSWYLIMAALIIGVGALINRRRLKE